MMVNMACNEDFFLSPWIEYPEQSRFCLIAMEIFGEGGGGFSLLLQETHFKDVISLFRWVLVFFSCMLCRSVSTPPMEHNTLRSMQSPFLETLLTSWAKLHRSARYTSLEVSRDFHKMHSITLL